MTIAAGTRLGRYEIRTPLGAGGMGEVYLAEDTQLSRRVALKLLPAEATRDQDSLRRFQQEARAASALSHPNIAHIYEIGEAGGVNFIAMEYVAGQSLSERINQQPLAAAEVASIGAQVADALDEAHQAGVTHRDIKSANIMLTARGRVKVLDFGLAKVVAPETESEAATRVKTKPGVVMGTVSYMSPEQAMGREVDARTDIWSLGVVLYEMATGRLPFKGESVTETIDAIAHAQPEAIARFNYDVPAELEVVIKKALRKKREERYQTARDMLVDLQTLARELELTGEHSVAPESRDVGAQSQAGASNTSLTAQQSIAPGSEQVTRTLTREQTATTDAVAAVHTASSAEYIVEKIKGHKKGFALALVLLVVLPVGGLALYRLWVVHHHTDEEPARPLSFQNAKLTRLTTTGKASNVAISPDGRYVVHVVDDSGQQSLWMRQTATQSNVQIVAPAEVRYDRLMFSHDGNFLYYVSGGALYQMPVLGGTARKLLTGVNSYLALSPDETRVVFARSFPGEGVNVLMLSNVDGTGERRLVTLKLPDRLFNLDATGRAPAWSPDGKRVSYPFVIRDPNAHETVFEVDVGSGQEKPISSSQPWLSVGSLAWLSDGSGLVLLASDQLVQGQYQIWYLSYPEGDARRITNDLNSYQSVSLTADSSSLVTAQTETVSNIWVEPQGDASRARQITNGAGKIDSRPVWTPDGRIVYQSTASGRSEIWIMDADGSNQKQLTFDGGMNPSVSPDGRHIFFRSNRKAGAHIWRIDIDGSNPKQLTNGGGEFVPVCSPDGKWVVHDSLTTGKRTLWKVPSDGGEPTQIINKRSFNAAVSPDGKWIACTYQEDQPDAPNKIAIIPFEGGDPVKLFDWPRRSGNETVGWTPDSRALLYKATQGSVTNIWKQPLDGGQAERLTNFTSEGIFSFSLSRDGRQFALARGTQSSDVVLISNFR